MTMQNVKFLIFNRHFTFYILRFTFSIYGIVIILIIHFPNVNLFFVDENISVRRRPGRIKQ